MFRQFVLLCRRLDLYGRELIAVDGTRIKAVNNKDRNFTRNSLRDFIRAADERLDDYLARLDASDVEDGARPGRAHEKPRREDQGLAQEARPLRGDAGATRPDRRGSDLADRSRQPRHGRAHEGRRGLQIQLAVDAKNKMIVEQAVTNQVVDMGLLTQTAEPARDILGVETIDVVADRGYFKAEDIKACEKPAAFLTFPNRSADRRCARASSARTSSDTTRARRLRSARPGRC